MAGEFGARLVLQRRVLGLVNRRGPQREELFGLSAKAIERWMTANQLDSNRELVRLVYSAAEQLSFLANRSQDHLSDEYSTAEVQIDAICEQLRRA